MNESLIIAQHWILKIKCSSMATIRDINLIMLGAASGAIKIVLK